MTPTDHDVLEAMQTYGGSFVQKLAELYLLADERNRAAIRAAWPNYWRQYRELATLDAEHNPRQKGDDDGVEYADPRDEKADRE